MNRGPVIASTVLSLLILLVWIGLVATLADLGSSDAAGNAMAQGFAAVEIIFVWILLGVVLVIAAVGRALPAAAALAALVLLIASGVAAVSAVDLLAHPSMPPFRLPIVTPALVPPFFLALCFWGLLPPLRAAVPAGVAVGTTLAAIFILSALLLPMSEFRDRAVQRVAVQRENWAKDFERLPADAPLWDVAPFLSTPDDTRQEAVLDRIRHLDRRQADAEAMLDRGDFPLVHLRAFDLDPTPTLCDKARAMLRRRAQLLVPQTPNSRPYADIALEVEGAASAMEWLVGYGCDCDAEALAWENMANAYRGSNFDVVRLREVRDPAALGKTLRDDPAHFSMLTPQSHLRAWLKFTDDRQLRDQALAGARQLDHRTDDAIEIMQTDQYGAYTLLMYLPVLDLQTTPAFCEAALKLLHDQFAPIYRPTRDDPRSYEELLGRLGIGRPLDALVWIASHGCSANDVLTEAEDLVRLYQDSPDRTAMLTRLVALHRG
jgi:hypothetical protein